jgi:uncharacterized protein (TIGR02284 family)
MEKSKETRNETTDILIDLIQIHNDRINGYEKAVRELHAEDIDLSELFLTMITESRKMKSALVSEVQILHGESDQGTSASGKIYRTWMDFKSMFSGHDRHSLLSNCEYGEDATQKAYRHALESDHLPVYIRQMIYEQRQGLKVSQNEIKELRDQYV